MKDTFVLQLVCIFIINFRNEKKRDFIIKIKEKIQIEREFTMEETYIIK
jgi:hypothetical protein